VAIADVNDQPDLYRVVRDPSRHWIELKLTGTASNRDAIGARVRITAGGVRQWQDVRGGGSYLSQNGLRVHFGLASAAIVDRVDVRWPNGREEYWERLAGDRLHTLVEGAGR
jgi:enediyne biosynthesis protein E4